MDVWTLTCIDWLRLEALFRLALIQ